MVFTETTYSVEIVSDSEKFNETIKPLLPNAEFWPVGTASTISEARQLMETVQPDIVILNAPVGGESGLKFAADAAQKTDACVIAFIPENRYEDIALKASRYGIITIAKPAPLKMIPQFIRTACAMRERVRTLEIRQETVEKKIDEMKLVNRAKWLLIECLSMTEPEAHRYIEKQAMNLRVTKREVAENIIKTYKSVPPVPQKTE